MLEFNADGCLGSLTKTLWRFRVRERFFLCAATPLQCTKPADVGSLRRRKISFQIHTETEPCVGDKRISSSMCSLEQVFRECRWLYFAVLFKIYLLYSYILFIIFRLVSCYAYKISTIKTTDSKQHIKMTIKVTNFPRNQNKVFPAPEWAYLLW